MHRLLLVPALLTIGRAAHSQYDSVRVITSTRVIARTDLPEQVVYDNAVLLQPATFPGGETALDAFFANTIGTTLTSQVEISFIIEPDGVVNEVRVGKGLGTEADKSVLRAALAMPAWEPAVVKGERVRARVVRTIGPEG